MPTRKEDRHASSATRRAHGGSGTWWSWSRPGAMSQALVRELRAVRPMCLHRAGYPVGAARRLALARPRYG
jgi:hypothetical protein